MTRPLDFVILALVVIGLAALDKSLEQIQTVDLAGTARQSWRRGSELLQAGKAGEAIESFRSAHALDRENREYEVELIVALMDAGKTGDADPLMNEALQRAPNDGRTNLIAARLANKEGRTGDAESYYHRAIYGEWPGNAAARRIATRMELIGFLREKAGHRQELLAELISLEAEAPPDKSTQRSLAQLFLTAGAPSRAADIYRALIEQDRKDTSAFAGLGEAELEQGRYRDAHSAYLQAFFHTPADAPIRARLQLLNTVMALDPTPRELPSAEKYRRSLLILDLTRDTLGQCAAKSPAAAGDMDKLLAEADDALAGKTPNRITNEMAEKVLTLAGEMWLARVKTCGGIPASEDALRMIMGKLGART